MPEKGEQKIPDEPEEPVQVIQEVAEEQAADEDEVDKLIEEMMDSIGTSSESQVLTMRNLD